MTLSVREAGLEGSVLMKDEQLESMCRSLFDILQRSLGPREGRAEGERGERESIAGTTRWGDEEMFKKKIEKVKGKNERREKNPEFVC